MDLLVYSEPVFRAYNERLERVMLATDFSDLNKAVDRMSSLQADIRQLRSTRHEFILRLDLLDEKGIKDMLTIDVEAHKVYVELVMMMEAIRNTLQKEKQETTKLVKWAIASDQIIWHLLDKTRRPMVDVGLADASFNRIENGEGFSANSIEIGMLQGFNLTPNSIYPEIISPFLDESKGGGYNNGEKVVALKWTMLEPIGGIPVMDLLEVKMQPVKVQLERDTGDKLFAYLFPSGKESPFNVNGRAKLKGNDGDDSDLTTISDSDSHSLLSTTSDQMSIYSGRSSIRQGGSIIGVGKGPHKARSGLLRSDSSVGSDTVSTTARKASGDHSRKKHHEEQNENDAAVMYTRASNYVSIVKVLIHGTTLCVSYKVRLHESLGGRGLFRYVDHKLTSGHWKPQFYGPS
jgi:hypothetical protein